MSFVLFILLPTNQIPPKAISEMMVEKKRYENREERLKNHSLR
jgi:hypothetical protein